MPGDRHSAFKPQIVPEGQTRFEGLDDNLQSRYARRILWILQMEGAKFWLGVTTELKNRGVKDLFIACVDGLKGLPEARQTVFRKTQVQQCIVQQMRASLS
jgi:putative transposase